MCSVDVLVNIVNEQDSVDDDDIKLGSQICLKVSRYIRNYVHT